MNNDIWRDRTSEFKTCLMDAQSRNVNSRVNYERVKAEPICKRGIFMNAAHRISEGMYATYVKLGKLGTLCKSVSLFDDRENEINDLTSIIKMDVTFLKGEIDALTQIMSKDDPNRSKHGKTHQRSILTSLEKRLAHMSKDFKGMLEIRSENMKIQRDRRDNFSKPINVPTLMNSQSLNLLNGKSETAVDMKLYLDLNEDTHSQRSSQHLSSTQKQQDQLVIVHESAPIHMQERLNAVRTIESTIVELGGIFQQLSHLVNEQEEHVARIDQNIEHANLNVEAANLELLKYLKNITSNRWLMIKIFGILFIFVVVFMLIS